MGLRVKNIAAGFYDSAGFHPIRRSPDYDADRAGDDYGSHKDAIGLKYLRKSKTRKAKYRKRSAKPERKAVQRAKNPITPQWTTGMIRKLGNDIQVMLFPKRKAAVRRSRRRR